jgi:hypothetical protein
MGTVIHHIPPSIEEPWQEENCPPFTQLILSWNARRPVKGKFSFYVRIKVDRWSSWLLYARWGRDGQWGAKYQDPTTSVQVYQDIVQVGLGQQATAFQIKIVPEGDASLTDIYGLHVYINSAMTREDDPIDPDYSDIYLPLPGISQMALHHPRCHDLCSPTATTAVIQYLTENSAIDPLRMADHVWDAQFDIFGNWVFNIAEASTYLGSEWDCWVERLGSFYDIHSALQQRIPVIVSVRGPLSGSALPYAKGHLLAVVGYDPTERRVLCMDPAFPTNDETHIAYPLADFLQAWKRRENIAYVFRHKHCPQ